MISDLSVFCIGIGPKQVIVVCKKITKEPTDECPSASKQKTSKIMDAEENLTKISKKSRIRPTQSYYVPPAQRSSTKKKKVKDNGIKPKKVPNKVDSTFENKPLNDTSETVILVNSSDDSLQSSHIIAASDKSSEPICFTDQNVASSNVECLKKDVQTIEIDNDPNCEQEEFAKCAMLYNVSIDNVESSISND